MNRLIVSIVIAAVIAVQVLTEFTNKSDKADGEFLTNDFILHNGDLILKIKLIDQILRNVKVKKLMIILTSNLNKY
jgi:hypothetical protein